MEVKWGGPIDSKNDYYFIVEHNDEQESKRKLLGIGAFAKVQLGIKGPKLDEMKKEVPLPKFDYTYVAIKTQRLGRKDSPKVQERLEKTLKEQELQQTASQAGALKPLGSRQKLSKKKEIKNVLIIPLAKEEHLHKVNGVELLKEKYIPELINLVAKLHELDIVHFDLKPLNLLTECKSDKLLLSDFGASTQNDPKLYTRGTPYWMAPDHMNESTIDEAYNSKKLDIWAIGIMTIESITQVPVASRVLANSQLDLNKVTIRGLIDLKSKQYSDVPKRNREQHIRGLLEHTVEHEDEIKLSCLTDEKKIQLCELLTGMIHQNWKKRLDAQSILEHPGFSILRDISLLKRIQSEIKSLASIKEKPGKSIQPTTQLFSKTI